MSPITTAVIPAAGIGSRFLPWTKAMPKEMLPIIDKPAIQYIVEECVAAGITEIVIVTDSRKRSIEDHFDYMPQLEEQLKKAGKEQAAEQIHKLAEMADFIYVRQKGPYGNATPVLSAQRVLGSDPFVVLWGDQFIFAQPSRLQQCLDVYAQYQCPVFAALKAEPEQLISSGIGRIEPFQDNIHILKEIVEKPGPDKAPSNLMVSGAYIFTPDIFEAMAQIKPGKDGELWLVDAINILARQRQCLTVEIQDGHFYDTGNKLAYHKTVLDFMLHDPEIGEQMREYMRGKLQQP